jgi:hypothetical protein
MADDGPFFGRKNKSAYTGQTEAAFARLVHLCQNILSWQNLKCHCDRPGITLYLQRQVKQNFLNTTIE